MDIRIPAQRARKMDKDSETIDTRPTTPDSRHSLPHGSARTDLLVMIYDLNCTLVDSFDQGTVEVVDHD